MSLTWSRVLQHKVFIVELPAVDGLAAGAVVVGEVASLTHELRNDAVEAGAFEAEALLVRAQAAEILCKRHKDLYALNILKSYYIEIMRVDDCSHLDFTAEMLLIHFHVANP